MAKKNSPYKCTGNYKLFLTLGSIQKAHNKAYLMVISMPFLFQTV